ncbi:hypothetical protein IH980_02110 [Patescibacteria group bacterium]|nr:hypothetical protein [Patescibacteria group bacterium]
MATTERSRATVAPIPLNEELQGVYDGLHFGVRSKGDPVTWRTFVVDLRRLVGVEHPDSQVPPLERFQDASDLVSALVEDTHLEPLVPEILCAIGEFEDLVETTQQGLDALLFNGRHYPEPLLFTLADELSGKDKSVAVVNPVGHYNDWETRIIAPRVTRPIDHFIIVASTQAEQGGSMEVLTKVIRTIRNPEFARNVQEVDVVIPMFGGSRGHRLGQDERVGYEVLEAIVNPKIPALLTKDFLYQLRQELGDEVPPVRFITVDVHNEEYPRRVFQEEGFEFVSADPTPELAHAAYQELEERGCLHLPLKVIACDKGAIPRTENMARALLFHPKNTLKSVDVIYIDKTRLAAGIIEEAEVVNVERWGFAPAGSVERRLLPVPPVDHPSSEACALLLLDDIFDTGETAAGDMQLAQKHYPNACMKIVAVPNPVLSKGVKALDRVGADVYLFGNTLKQEELLTRADVHTVDMAPAIARVIVGSDS